MQTRILAALADWLSRSTGTRTRRDRRGQRPGRGAPSQIDRPKRGTTMGDVEKHFGAPVNRHPTVGAPPITRWDYNGFSVFFERDRVIDAVVTSG